MRNSSLVKWVCAENERGSNSIPKLRINRGIKFTNETRKYLTKTEEIKKIQISDADIKDRILRLRKKYSKNTSLKSKVSNIRNYELTITG